MKTNSTVLTASQKRSMYGKTLDKKIRSFSSYLSEFKKDIDAINLPALKEDLKALKAEEKAAKDRKENAETLNQFKQQINTLNERIKVAENWLNASENFIELQQCKDMFAATGMKRENVTISYLKTWLPEAIDKDGNICDVSLIPLEEQEAAEAEAAEKGYYILKDGAKMFLLKPVKLWTGTKLLTKFSKAAKAEKAAARQASQLEREKAKAERQKAEIERMRKLVAEADAKAAEAEAKDK